MFLFLLLLLLLLLLLSLLLLLLLSGLQLWLFENLVICHVPVHVNQLQESAIFVVSDIRSPERSVVSWLVTRFNMLAGFQKAISCKEFGVSQRCTSRFSKKGADQFAKVTWTLTKMTVCKFKNRSLFHGRWPQHACCQTGKKICTRKMCSIRTQG